MEIKYLTQLNNNRTVDGISGFSKTLQPIPLEEIIYLEKTYNADAQFPVALRELLSIAGSYCYVLDYGLNNSQQEMQESARELMNECGVSILRPFFVIDVYNASDQFLFVFLDDDQNDPNVYSACMPVPGIVKEFPRDLKRTLSSYINRLVGVVLSGQNPF